MQIHATLVQICSEGKMGQGRRQAFNTDMYEGVYITHIEYLNNICSKSVLKYHRLMADLYKAAWYILFSTIDISPILRKVDSVGTRVDWTRFGGASIDIDGMSE